MSSAIGNVDIYSAYFNLAQEQYSELALSIKFTIVYAVNLLNLGSTAVTVS